MKIIRFADSGFVAASHEDPQNPGVLKRVLAVRDDFSQGRVQMLNWARLPQGSSFAAHYHQDMQETFVILNGEVEITVGEQSSTLSAGDAIIIDREEVHQMHNRCGDDVDYLVFGIASEEGGKTIVVKEVG